MCRSHVTLRLYPQSQLQPLNLKQQWKSACWGFFFYFFLLSLQSEVLFIQVLGEWLVTSRHSLIFIYLSLLLWTVHQSKEIFFLHISLPAFY